MNWHEFFIYEPKNGNLIWRINRGAGKAGHIAGTPTHRGYRHVMVKGKQRGVHRVIWEMKNGEIPEGMQIDHIDHDRSNNRIQNLRLVTMQQNNRNISLGRRNTSGAMGVHFHKPTGKWCSQITIDGKVRHLGLFTELADAIECRKSAEVKAGYHSNHGASPITHITK